MSRRDYLNLWIIMTIGSLSRLVRIQKWSILEPSRWLLSPVKPKFSVIILEPFSDDPPKRQTDTVSDISKFWAPLHNKSLWDILDYTIQWWCPAVTESGRFIVTIGSPKITIFSQRRFDYPILLKTWSTFGDPLPLSLARETHFFLIIFGPLSGNLPKWSTFGTLSRWV